MNFRVSLIGFAASLAVVGIAYGAGEGANTRFASEPRAASREQERSDHVRPVQLALAAEKKTVALDQRGKSVVVWKRIEAASTAVQPADVVRYSVIARNAGELPVRDLSITQPVPLGTRYILDSAAMTTDHAPQITYSIDNGQTFTANPTIQVTLPNGKVETRPAPAEMYTHVRWTLTRALDPAVPAKVSYLVRVR
jgi:uncharacterized repeat protein (TIGR01451 family)